MFPSICRICLTGHVKMFHIGTIGLQEIYEKFTNNKLITEDGRPMIICYMCRSLLLKSYGFYKMSQNAEKLLSDLVNGWQDTGKTDIQLNQGLLRKLSCSSVETTTINDTDNCDQITLKKEIETDNIECVEVEYEGKSNIKKYDDDLNGFRDNNVCHLEVDFEKKKKTDTQNHITHHKNNYCINSSNPPKTDLNIIKNEEPKTTLSEKLIKKKLFKKSCYKCHRVFTSVSHLKEHLKSHRGSKYICTKCDESFCTGKLFKQHSIKKHNEPKPFLCDLCKKSFSEKSYLNKHEQTHSDVVSCTCDICGKGFIRQITLRKHMLTHNKVRSKICNICSKSFVTSNLLNQHLKIHSGRKPYPCTRCSKCFRTNQALKAHMRTHTGEKPYLCEPCGRAFSAKYKLDRHNAYIHSGVKSHICDICQKSYYSMSNLRIHMRTHTGEKPFICECNRAFSAKSSLERHTKDFHGGLKVFACEICDTTFSNKSELKGHIRKCISASSIE